MKEVIVRKVKLNDLRDVVNIQVSGWQTAYRGIVDDNYLDNMNVEEKLDKRKRDYLDSGFIVAEINGEVVGFCRFIDSNIYSSDISIADCELMALYVKPDRKRNGIGKKLIEYVKEYFKSIGKTKMVLWCLKDNEPSKIFYEKMGGKIIRERPITIGNKEYAEVCFLYNI